MQELQGAAARHLTIFLDQFTVDFEKQHAFSIKLSNNIPFGQGWQALRSITLSLDMDYFTDFFARYKSKNDRYQGQLTHSTLDASRGYYNHLPPPVYKFLRHRFDKVTLLVTDALVDAVSVDEDRLQKYQDMATTLRDSLDTMTEEIGNDWLGYQSSLDLACFDDYEQLQPLKRLPQHTAEIWRFQCVQYKRINTKHGLREAMSSSHGGRRIQAKQISFACNFLPSSNPAPAKLQGKKLTYPADIVERFRKEDKMRRLKYEKQWPHKYEVMAADGLVGEIGIHHPKRWILASEEHTEYKGVTHGMWENLMKAEDGESSGIGMDIVKAKKPRAKKAKAGK
jgi:hypothetical protein